MASNPIFVGTIKNALTRLQNSDSTNFVALIAAGANGTKIEAIAITSDDTSARVVQLAIASGGVDYPIGEISVPAGAGTDGSTKAVDGLNQTDLPWLRDDGANPYLYLENGSTLKAKVKSAVTAAKYVNLYLQGGNV